MIRFRTLSFVALIVCIATALGACGSLSAGPTTAELAAQSAQLTQAMTAATQATTAAKAAIDAARTPPTGVAVSPDPAPLTKASAAIGKASDAMAATTQVLGAMTASLQASATQPASDPTAAGIKAAGAAATVAAPLAGPYAPWVYLAGIGLGLAGTIIGQAQKKTASIAAQKNTDAVQNAIANGQLSVASPAVAAAAVNAVVADHPIGDALVDVIAGATAPAK